MTTAPAATGLRSISLAFVAMLASVMLFALSTPEADAAVGLRGVSCNSFSIAFWPPYSMDIDKPAGTVAGDLMVATVRTSGWYSASAGPAGWTESLNGNAGVTLRACRSGSARRPHMRRR